MVALDDLALSSLSGGLTLVKSSLNQPGLFIIQQYFRWLLQYNYAVILVNTEQSVEHYKYVAKKMGLSLQSYESSGHLVCLQPPLARPLGRQQLGQPSGNGGSTTTDAGLREPPHVSGLQELYAAVCRAVAQRPPTAAGVAVVVDSLTALASLGASPEEWPAFLHYCCSGIPSAEREVPYCFIAGVYDDVPDDQSWLASLEHRANLVVSVEPLPGRIADVDGLVTITRRGFPMAAGGGSAALGAEGYAPSQTQAPLGAGLGLRQSLYFRTTELAIKWMDHITTRELM